MSDESDSSLIPDESLFDEGSKAWSEPESGSTPSRLETGRSGMTPPECGWAATRSD